MSHKNYYSAAGKKEKPPSVSAMLASMDKPAPNARPAARPNPPRRRPPRPRHRPAPPSDEEEDVAAVTAKAKYKPARATVDLNAIALSDKDSKKKDKRQMMAEVAKPVALRVP
ncbi:hypothetical protein ZWY2020_048540 [Hordeum vulgare]|nr:hypothetical protein ZWY2020_048540 [Hordeum vulgare]